MNRVSTEDFSWPANKTCVSHTCLFYSVLTLWSRAPIQAMQHSVRSVIFEHKVQQTLCWCKVLFKQNNRPTAVLRLRIRTAFTKNQHTIYTATRTQELRHRKNGNSTQLHLPHPPSRETGGHKDQQQIRGHTGSIISPAIKGEGSPGIKKIE